MNTPTAETPRHVQVRKTPKGWNLQMDNASWAELMAGLSIAIDTLDRPGALPAERERAARLRYLRSDLSKVC